MRWGLISGMATEASLCRRVVPALPAEASGGDISEQKMGRVPSIAFGAGGGA
jgi:hypothetical protein